MTGGNKLTHSQLPSGWISFARRPMIFKSHNWFCNSFVFIKLTIVPETYIVHTYYIYIYLSIYPSIHPSIHPSIYHVIYIYIYCIYIYMFQVPGPPSPPMVMVPLSPCSMGVVTASWFLPPEDTTSLGGGEATEPGTRSRYIMYIYIYLHTYIHTYIYIYIYIYIWGHTWIMPLSYPYQTRITPINLWPETKMELPQTVGAFWGRELAGLESPGCNVVRLGAPHTNDPQKSLSDFQLQFKILGEFWGW